MKRLLHFATAKITSDRLDARVLQIVIFAAGLFIFGGAILKLSSLNLDEWQLLMGVLLAIACLLLTLLLGLVLPLTISPKSGESRNGSN